MVVQGIELNLNSEHCVKMGYDVHTINRFFDKVIIPKDYKYDCWEWQAYKDKNGYGTFLFCNKTGKSHRFSYEIFYGEIPKGSIIRHSCDNTGCQSPFHILNGTHYDNAQDKVKRNRQTSGEDVNTAKLSELEVQNILISLWEGESIPKLANQYFISKETIKDISKGRTWKHIYRQLSESQKKMVKRGIKQLFDLKDLDNIRALYKTDANYAKIARAFKVNQSTIYSVVNFTGRYKK